MHFGTTSWSEHGLKMALLFYLWSNQGIIMLSMYASCTIHIYDDFLITTTLKKNQHNRPLADLAHHRVGANCHFAAEPLHDKMTEQMATRLTLHSFKCEKRSLYCSTIDLDRCDIWSHTTA